jgi:hypothetical protein
VYTKRRYEGKIDRDLREINCMDVEVDKTGSGFCAVCKIDKDLREIN